MDQETAREEAWEKINKLVEKFCAQQKNYEGYEYNEASCRTEFINPLFAALGWDIENNERLAPRRRSVRFERDYHDYSFWIGEKQVFIVEAKRPSVNLKEGTSANEAARQLRQYGWDANLAVSIVTNFRQFVVYDCTKEPREDDTAHVGRLRYLSLNDFIRTGFDYLWEKFSYDGVCRSGWEKYTRVNSRFPKTDDTFQGTDLISGVLRAKIERLMEKYRPKSYYEIVGNAESIRYILQSVNKNNGFGGLLFMFLGETGCGKTLLADMIAKEINGNTYRIKCTEDGDVEKMIDHIWQDIGVIKGDMSPSNRNLDLEWERSNKNQTVYIFAEADKLSSANISRFKGLEDSIVERRRTQGPCNVTLIFTTTKTQLQIYESHEDWDHWVALQSRCKSCHMEILPDELDNYFAWLTNRVVIDICRRIEIPSMRKAWAYIAENDINVVDTEQDRKRKRDIEIVRNMKQEGLSTGLIAKITGLSESEIAEI